MNEPASLSRAHDSARFKLFDDVTNALYEAEHLSALARWIESAREVTDRLARVSEHDKSLAEWLERYGIAPYQAVWTILRAKPWLACTIASRPSRDRSGNGWSSRTSPSASWQCPGLRSGSERHRG